jgi:hypothetical protein
MFESKYQEWSMCGAAAAEPESHTGTVLCFAEERGIAGGSDAAQDLQFATAQCFVEFVGTRHGSGSSSTSENPRRW